ncbi:hypothetical protein CKO15_00790 [Halorhodospira abdelmalekii]|uniref:virulence factor SrfC family protein n=1 Tax=Halorhodospira abdelmalekii TaxID=421629 RepID=UPI001905E00E|nr:virulence factor SrfC family protein [Halorhodospira abdelmalekii]MBK1733838.1 hypothetical protein [Halorhodospira abdelmalekii]
MKEKCETLTQQIQNGIDWTSKHLEREQGQMDVLAQLKEVRRRGRRLARAAGIRPAVGVFGASQHGKSYLVSNMVRTREESPLEVVLPPDRQAVDFQRDMNPTGGQESTGTVTRFTIHDDCPSGQPGIQLELLTQTELAAVLAHGYLANVHQEGVAAPPDIEAFQEQINRLSGGAGQSERDGLTEDDIFDLRDYLEQHFPKDARITELRRMGYWEQVAALAPRLEARQRAELFAWLWEQVPSITGLYQKLSGGLSQLGFARFAATDKDAVMPKVHKESLLPRTILDVGVVAGLATNDGGGLDPVQVSGESGVSVSMDRAVFTALIKEVVLPIPEVTANHEPLEFLKHADVLDFPGARTPQTISYGKLEPNADEHVVSMKELFVRGKVSFLFASYDTGFRVTTLLIGQRDGNPEVKEVPLLTYDWIQRNIGGSAEERQGKANRFFFVGTFWNNELEKQAGSEEDHATKWQARLSKNFAEEWQHARDQDQWIKEWTPGKPFMNCYFVRDPRFSKAIFSTSEVSGMEDGIQPHHKEQMEMMRQSFINSPVVRKHVHDPERMWEETATPNRFGTRYLLEGIRAASSDKDKVEQIRTQFHRQKQDALAVLRSMHHDEDAAEERKKAEKNAQVVGRAMMKVVQKGVLGLLLERLYISEEVAWSVYYNVEVPELQKESADGEGPAAPNGLEGKISGEDLEDIFPWLKQEQEQEQEQDESEQSSKVNLLWDKADAYADEVMDRWFMSLTSLLDDEDELALFGLDMETARILVNGIKDASRRRRLRDRVKELVRPGLESAHSSLWVDLCARLTTLEINRFVNDFDWGRFPETERPTVKFPGWDEQVPIFKNMKPETVRLEDLDLDDKNVQLSFPVSWIQGLYSALVANADEITFDVEANRRLGEIVEQVDAL